MRSFALALSSALIFSLLFLVPGCGELQKAIDKISTQNVDFSQGIYDGEPVRGPASLPLAGSVTVSNTGPVDAGEISVLPIAENILALQAGIPEADMGFSGAISNNGPGAGRLYILFSPSSSPEAAEALRIGSVVVGPGRTFSFESSSGFEQTSEEVKFNLKTFFDQNPYDASIHLFLWCENGGQGSVIVNNLAIDSTPVFAQVKVIPADFASSSGGTIRDIVTVSVGGNFANHGAAPAHFVWVVGPDEENLTISENLVIDVTLDPGESTDIFDALVVPDGLRRLKSGLKRLADGNSVKGILLAASDENVDAEIDRFKIDITAEVGQ